MTTLFASNNFGNAGGAIYFDVEASNTGGITVTDLEINTGSIVAFNLDVYVTPNTAAGKETDMTLWSHVSSGSGTGLGTDNRTPVDVVDFALAEGRWGIALVLGGTAEHRYTTGNGSEVYRNADVEIVPVSATNMPFTGMVFQPRIWNGSLCYQAVPGMTLDAGPFLAAGMAYTVRPGTRRTDGSLLPVNAIYTKKDGQVAGTEAPTTGARPDFRFAAMFPTNPAIEIDAMSIGEDLLWVDPMLADGRIMNAPPLSPAPPTLPGSWLTISLSVDRSATNTSGAIRNEMGDSDGAAADVFNYIPRGVALPGRYLGRTFRALDGSDLDLDPPSAFPRPDIQSLDAHIPAHYLDDEFGRTQLTPPTFYFSVTDATKNAIPMSWRFHRGSARPGVVSGAIILRTTWDPAMRNWTTPDYYCMPVDLGLTRADDIDALALDFSYYNSPGDPVHILYSTVDGSPLGDELTFVAKAGHDFAPPAVYEESDETPVSSNAGTGTVIDGVCGSDPGPTQSGMRRFLWGSPVDTTRTGLGVALPTAAWSSSLRSCYTAPSGARIGRIRSYMSGWLSPPTGSGGEVAFFFLTFVDPAFWSLAGPAPVLWSFQVRSGAYDEVLVETIPYRASMPALLDAGLWTFWASSDGTSVYTTDLSYIRT